MKEVSFYCPYCNAQDSIILDQNDLNRNYIIDCEVCASPYKVHFGFKHEMVEEDLELQVA